MAGKVDLVIENALVVDGTGWPGYGADVSVKDGKIAEIGVLSDCNSRERINATGLVLCPGFIDVHTHDDVALLNTPDMPFKLSQGVTTVIAGNCGMSVAPLASTDRMPPPFPWLGEPDVYRFPTVADYRAELETSPAAVNVALLIGHSTLRLGAMPGDLAAAASAEEIDAMAGQLNNALSQGAIGLSSGLEYPPAEQATMEEMVTLAKVLSRHPDSIYTTHMRDEGEKVVDSVRETLETGRQSGAKVVISHHKCAGPKNYGLSTKTLNMIAEAQEHQDVTLDVYPYTASSTSLIPKFIDDAESILVSWSTPHPECEGKLLSDIATEWNCSELEAAEKLYPAGAVYFQMDEDDLRRIMAYPTTMIGSDGLPGRSKPHPRLWGTFPRVLSRYVREQALLSLQHAIRKMTGLSAETFGLHDRGLIYPGFAADLVLFDPQKVADTATFEEPESPAAGIRRVFVNGELAWADGISTGSRSGRFLTH